MLKPKKKLPISYEEMERALEERDRRIAEEEREKTEGPLGDGKAVFLADMTDEEYEKYVMEEEKGWGGFIKEVFNLNKNETNRE